MIDPTLPHGLVGDGEHLDSPALQHAIDAAAAAGGGTVNLPPGTYRCGTLHLRSRVTLHLQPGAVIRGSADIADYPPSNYRSPDKDRHPHHLIVMHDCDQVRICGGGTIDGQGAAFWEPALASQVWIRPRAPRVSPMIEMTRCRDVRIDDITLREAAGWTLHAHGCDRLWLRGVAVQNHPFGPNNDGFDLNGCRDVFISDCLIDTCDDAIVLKTSRDARSCERVVIQNCILRTNCVAIKCGTESWHDFRHLTISNCVVHRSNRGVGLYAFDGATIEHVTISNLVIDTNLPFVFNHPVHLDARRRTADSAPSTIRAVTLQNVSVCTDGRLLFTAADDCRVEHLTLRDIRLDYPLRWDPQPLAPHVASGQCSRNSPEARAARAAIVADGVEHLHLSGLSIAWPAANGRPGWGDGLPRMENGGDRRFGPADHPDEAPFHAFWGRRLTQGRIDLRGCTASDPAHPTVALSEDSRTSVTMDS
jgi:hypothetical protein